MRAFRLFLRGALWTLCCVFALLASTAYHLRLQITRNIARDLLNSFVSTEIRGELAIGRFDELTARHAVARHVALFDGEGRRIIVADRVELEMDLWQLPRGTLDFRVGRIIGATVRLIPNDQNDPSLFTTFDSGKPAAVPGGEPLHVLVERLELVDATLYGQMVELRGVRAEHVQAEGRLEVGHTVEVRIARAKGQLVQPFDLVGEIDQLTGTISTDRVRGVKLDVLARRNDEDARAHVEYRSSAPLLPQELDLVVSSQHLTPDTLRRLDFSFAEPLSPSLRGTLHLAGPPQDLALQAAVESEAGNVAVSGTISTAQGVTVHLQSQSIVVDKLVDNAPAVTVRGMLQIAVNDAKPRPQLHAELAALHYRGLLVPAFEFDGELEDNGIRIERARTTQGGQLALRGRVGFDGRSDVQLDARFPVLQRDPNLSRYVNNLEGMLVASLHIRTPESKQPARLDVTGRIELHDAHYGSLRATHLSLSGSVSGDPQLPRVDLQVQGEGFQLLSYNLGRALFSLRGGPRDYVAQGEFEAQGQKTFNFNASVVADRQSFVIQADPIEFSVGTESWRGLIRDLKIVNEQSVELGLLRLASRAQRLEAQGILRVKGEDGLHAQLQNFDLAAVHALLGAGFPLSHGYADASLEIQGDVDHPVLSVQGALREAKWHDFDTVDALYTVDYSAGRLEVDTEIDLPGRGTLHVVGEGELDANIADPRDALAAGLYNVQLTGSDVDLTIIPGLQPLVSSGRLDASVEAWGGLESLEVHGNFTAKGVTGRDFSAIDLASSFQYGHDDLTSNLHIQNAHGALLDAETSLKLDWKRLQDDPQGYVRSLVANDFRIAGHTTDRALDELPLAGAWTQWPLRFGSTFELARRGGQLEGTLSGQFRAKTALWDPSCQVSNTSALSSTWQLRGDHIIVAFTGQLDGHDVGAGGGAVDWPFDTFLRGLPVETPPRADLNGHIDVDHLERVPGLCRHGRGDLHAHWDLRSLFSAQPSGEVAMHGTVVPEVNINAGDVDQRIVSCPHEPLYVELSAQANAREITWSGETRGCSGGPSALRGVVPVHWDEAHPMPALDDDRELVAQLDFQDTQLEPLLDYMPGVTGFSARARGQLSARATHGHVDYRGQLSIADGKLYVSSMGQQFNDVSIALSGNGNWMKLERVSAHADRGSFEATGGLGFDRWQPRRVQLGVLFNDFPVTREGIEFAWLTGGAAVSGDVEATRSRTAIKINALSVRLPDASTRSPITLDPHTDIALTTDPPKHSGAAAYTFEFAIEGQQRISARRNDFEAGLATEVDISYQDPALRLGGYIEFRRGTFNVFGKDFEVNRGSMRFDGSTELDPEINLVATHQPDVVGASPVFVTVNGTLSKPEVAFYSDQCPGEGAVVLLVSGRCPSDADTGYSDTRGTQDAFAAGIIGGILTLGARRQLGGLIPRLAVESSAHGRRTRLKAGFEAVPPFMRSLVQRVYLQGALSTADTGAVDSTTQSVTTPDFLMELYFPNNIVGAARVAPTARSWGLDVTWEP